MDLPRIDVHRAEVEAPPEITWEALTDWIARGWSRPSRVRFASLLGCDQVKVSGSPGQAGSTFPGFRVVRADPPRELALEGGHRFSDYRLDFEVEPLGENRSLLSATTHAAFPGLKGRLYKTLVIGSRAHVLVTKRMLKAVGGRAEHGRLAG